MVPLGVDAQALASAVKQELTKPSTTIVPAFVVDESIAALGADSQALALATKATSFRHHLLTLVDDELAKITASYERFREAEDSVR